MTTTPEFGLVNPPDDPHEDDILATVSVSCGPWMQFVINEEAGDHLVIALEETDFPTIGVFANGDICVWDVKDDDGKVIDHRYIYGPSFDKEYGT